MKAPRRRKPGTLKTVNRDELRTRALGGGYQGASARFLLALTPAFDAAFEAEIARGTPTQATFDATGNALTNLITKLIRATVDHDPGERMAALSSLLNQIGNTAAPTLLADFPALDQPTPSPLPETHQ